MAVVHPVKLILKIGPNVGEEYAITQDVTIIGRDTQADISIQHQVISRKHAQITRIGPDWWLEDLQSSNGTYLNSELLKGRVKLRNGDKIGLGHEVALQFDAQISSTETRLEQATRIEVDATMRESPVKQIKPVLQIELTIRISGQVDRKILLSKEQYTIGRGEDNDIVLQSRIVSRHHALLTRIGDGYQLGVLPEASNPLLLNRGQVSGVFHLYDQDEIQVESTMSEHQVTLVYHSPGEPRPEAPAYAQPAETILGSAGRLQDSTLLDANVDLGLPVVPPQLVVTIAGQTTTTHKLTANQITIGRSEDNDVVIPSQIISRHHARLDRMQGGYQLVVLPDVINTLVCGGKPITDRVKLQHGDVLRIDSSIPGMMVTMVYHSPSEAQALQNIQIVQFGEKDKLTFGRDASNDICLDAPTVSRFHAQLDRVGRRYRLTDLQSANGTFVNDNRVTGEEWLNPQDSVRIGSYRFIVGEDQLTRYDETSGLRVQAQGLQKWVRKNVNILKDISLVFQPREFIVVVGQSGGGKSTLLDAIAGYRPATHGRVTVNGIDIYKNFDAIRSEIGFVPQRDIIHTELTVKQALEYAAKLRMPADTSKAEREQRINEVLTDLDLAHRKDTQISRLSGGQQKRVSIGVELLTRPGLFFLDEPTSGLDPGTETAFMHLMRRLADQGRTIILVTHATKNVMLADKVVFLARGGHLAWFGPPDEALEFFDQFRSERERRMRPMEFDQIYAILDDASKGSAEEWEQRYKKHTAYPLYIVEPLRSASSGMPLVEAAAQAKAPAVKKKRARTSSGLRQFFVLSARNLKILTRDRSSLILMLMAAPIIACLDFVIAPLMGSAPFNFINGDAPNAAITLFLLTVYCLLVAGLSQMREIVKEADIYRRERLVNLQILPYVSSKVWVALLLAFYHGAAYTIVHYLAFDMPGGNLDFGLFYGTMVLAAMAGMMYGLLASALSPAASSAPLIIIMLLVPQIVLSGALAPVPENISQVASTRWAFQGLIGITGIGSDVAADPCWKLSAELRDAMDLDAKRDKGCNCMGTALFTPDSCNFPGIGQYYKPELDQPEPVEPPDLGEKPPEPVIPAAPDPPADQNDSVAVAQYLNALQSYQDDVTRIQEEYKNQMSLYESTAKVYEAEMTQYQRALADWNIGRNSAVQEAEGVIESVNEEFGWGWVNKKDPDAFWPWLTKTWVAQFILICVIFLLILVLMKRKDVK